VLLFAETLKGTSRNPHAPTQDTQPLQSNTAVHGATTFDPVNDSYISYTQANKERIEEAHRSRESATIDSLNDPGLDELQARDAHIVSCECGSSTDEGDLVSAFYIVPAGGARLQVNTLTVKPYFPGC
jgi:hypothetical protein